MAPRFLHVANGTATTRLIQAAGITGRLTIWADPLYEGPVPGGLTDAELIQARARHLAGPSEDSHAVARGLQGWRDAIENIDSYDELVLWYSTTCSIN